MSLPCTQHRPNCNLGHLLSLSVCISASLPICFSVSISFALTMTVFISKSLTMSPFSLSLTPAVSLCFSPCDLAPLFPHLSPNFTIFLSLTSSKTSYTSISLRIPISVLSLDTLSLAFSCFYYPTRPSPSLSLFFSLTSSKSSTSSLRIPVLFISSSLLRSFLSSCFNYYPPFLTRLVDRIPSYWSILASRFSCFATHFNIVSKESVTLFCLSIFSSLCIVYNYYLWVNRNPIMISAFIKSLIFSNYCLTYSYIMCFLIFYLYIRLLYLYIIYYLSIRLFLYIINDVVNKICNNLSCIVLQLQERK